MARTNRTQSRQVIIRRFALGPLAQWGFVTGVIVACLPAFLCSWALFSLVSTVRHMLADWRDVGISLLGQRISVNLVDLLSLQDALQTLTTIAGLGFVGIVLLALGMAALLVVFGAVVLTILGLFYNTTGHVQLELEETATVERAG